MKKQGLLALIQQVKIRAEQTENPVPPEITRMELMDLLLDYINDPTIRQAVDEVPF